MNVRVRILTEGQERLIEQFSSMGDPEHFPALRKNILHQPLDRCSRLAATRGNDDESGKRIIRRAPVQCVVDGLDGGFLMTKKLVWVSSSPDRNDPNVRILPDLRLAHVRLARWTSPFFRCGFSIC